MTAVSALDDEHRLFNQLHILSERYWGKHDEGWASILKKKIVVVPGLEELVV